MTVTLVTGHTGNAHITSADVAGFNSLWHMHGTVRMPRLTYVGDATGDKVNECAGLTWPAVTVIGTTATIPAGMWLINGRLIENSGATTLEVPSHSAGSAREDVLYMTYSIDSEGVESAGLELHESGANPAYADPSNMLWPNSPSNGGSPIAVLSYDANSTSPKVTMFGARHFPEDFVYRRVWNMWGGQLEYIQHGCVCTLVAHSVHKNSKNSWYAMHSDIIIPECGRPLTEHSCPVNVDNSGQTTGYLGVYPDGSVQLGNRGSWSSTDACSATLTWVVS